MTSNRLAALRAEDMMDAAGIPRCRVRLRREAWQAACRDSLNRQSIDDLTRRQSEERMRRLREEDNLEQDE